MTILVLATDQNMLERLDEPCYPVAVMSDVGTAPLQVVGYEGVFGCLAMFCVLLPIVQHTPGQDGTGLHEDTWETLHVSNPTLAICVKTCVIIIPNWVVDQPVVIC